MKWREIYSTFVSEQNITNPVGYSLRHCANTESVRLRLDQSFFAQLGSEAPHHKEPWTESNPADSEWTSLWNEDSGLHDGQGHVLNY